MRIWINSENGEEKPYMKDILNKENKKGQRIVFGEVGQSYISDDVKCDWQRLEGWWGWHNEAGREN